MLLSMLCSTIFLILVVWFLLPRVVIFFKQKTAYEMSISDWSSDVCSADLYDRRGEPRSLFPRHRPDRPSHPYRRGPPPARTRDRPRFRPRRRAGCHGRTLLGAATRCEICASPPRSSGLDHAPRRAPPPPTGEGLHRKSVGAGKRGKVRV